MNKRRLKSCISALLLSGIMWGVETQTAEASNGEEYIFIRVQASDDNGNLQYALDSDDASAFTSSNEFRIPAGTSHTIYVKDAAGNITSQTYTPENSHTAEEYGFNASDDKRQEINIDFEIGSGNDENTDYSDYEYLTDIPITSAEDGTGTVYDRLTTDGTNTAEKVFYTVTTEEGDVFYLIIDQGRGTDNVYLLDTVKRSDLLALTADGVGSGQEESEKEANLLNALYSTNDEPDQTDTVENTTKKKTGTSGNVVILMIMLAGGAAYYYFKVYRNKKDEMMDTIDAMDMEDFVPGDDEEEEEIEFETDDDEKQKILDNLLDAEDMELSGAIDPADYDDLPEEYEPQEDFVTDIDDSEFADVEEVESEDMI